MNGDVEALYRGLERDLAQLIPAFRFSAAINLRLERIGDLLARLGNPHQAFPAIHVGGTSGKGSTAAMAAAILTAAGYKTGLHISPHLQILNERHQIDGRMAPTSQLVYLYEEMRPAMEAVAAENPFGRPSYFEVQVALAFMLFRQEAVDVAVVEVGVGGTLDATNVLPAPVAVLTSVGLDHTELLGDTVEAIAADKAGIIKPGQAVVSGAGQPSVQAIIRQRCLEQGATLWQLGQEFTYQRVGGGQFDLQLPDTPTEANARALAGLEVGLLGEFQMANAALAVAAVERMPGFTIPDSAIRAGLAGVRLPGRMEKMQTEPLVILDGAHNPDKLAGALRTIRPLAQDRRCIVVFGAKSDKAVAEMLATVIEVADRLILTQFHVKGLWLPYDPDELARLVAGLAPDLPVEVVGEPEVAVEVALAAASSEDLVWITGSLYLAGDARERWYPSEVMLADLEREAV